MERDKDKHCAISFRVEYGDREVCELISTDCVLYPKNAPILGLPINSDLTTLITNLLLYLQRIDEGGGGGTPVEDTYIYVEGEKFRYRKELDNLTETLEKGDVAYDGWYFDNNNNRWHHVVSMRYVGTNGVDENSSLIVDWEMVADSYDTESEVNDYEEQITNGLDF